MAFSLSLTGSVQLFSILATLNGPFNSGINIMGSGSVKVDGNIAVGGTVTFGSAGGADEGIITIATGKKFECEVMTWNSGEIDVVATGQFVHSGAITISAEAQATFNARGSAGLSFTSDSSGNCNNPIIVKSKGKFELKGNVDFTGTKAEVQTEAEAMLMITGETTLQAATSIKGSGEVVVQGSLVASQNTIAQVDVKATVKANAELVVASGAQMQMKTVVFAASSKTKITAKSSASAGTVVEAITCTSASLSGAIMVDMSAYTTKPDFDVVLIASASAKLSGSFTSSQITAGWSAGASAGRRLEEEEGCIVNDDSKVYWTDGPCSSGYSLASNAVASVALVTALGAALMA